MLYDCTCYWFLIIFRGNDVQPESFWDRVGSWMNPALCTHQALYSLLPDHLFITVFGELIYNLIEIKILKNKIKFESDILTKKILIVILFLFISIHI